MLRGEAAQQLGGAGGPARGGDGTTQPARGGQPARSLCVAAAQQLAAVTARGERGGGGGIGAADVLERGQHPVGDDHGGADPGQHVDALSRRGRRPHDVLDAETAGDLGGHHDIRVVVEPVGPGHDQYPGLHQRGGDEPAVLAAGQAELDRAARLPQRRDRGDKSLGDVPRSA